MGVSLVQRGMSLELGSRLQRGTSLASGEGRHKGNWRAVPPQGESIIEAMVIDMNEVRVRTLEQLP